MGEGTKRNKPCPCGSGKKYKSCCLERTSTFSDLESGKTVKDLFKKSKPKKCYFSHDKKCSTKVIKAHSIQNNRILREISEKGYVVMYGFDFKEFNPLGPGIKMMKKGRKIATTFTGFCSHHDQTIFTEIDNKNYVIGNKKQDFLFAFRGLCFEFYKKETAKSVFESAEEKKFIKNKNFVNAFLMGTNKAIKDLKYYFELFKKGIESNNYDILETVTITLKSEYLLAVNSLFGLEYDLRGNMINDLSDSNKRLKVVFLNIFPQNGNTFIVLSWLKENINDFSDFKKQILSLKKENKKINLLNNIIFNYTENLTLGPKLWNKFDAEEKQLFNEILGHPIELIIDKNALSKKSLFNLFRKT